MQYHEGELIQIDAGMGESSGVAATFAAGKLHRVRGIWWGVIQNRAAGSGKKMFRDIVKKATKQY